MKTQDIINMGLAWKQVTEKMSSKEKMKRGLYNSFVIPEDVPVDERDMFMAKAAAAHKAGKSHFTMPGGKKHPVTMKKDTARAVNSSANEAKDLNKANADAAIQHDCATHVEHATWGQGQPLSEQHTIVETSPGVGYVTHYDVLFEHGVEKNVAVEDLTILAESSHGHMRKKKMKEAMRSADKKPQMYVDPKTGKKKVRMMPHDNEVVDNDKDDMKENKQMALQKALQKSAQSSEKGKAAVTLPKPPFKVPAKEMSNDKEDEMKKKPAKGKDDTAEANPKMKNQRNADVQAEAGMNMKGNMRPNSVRRMKEAMIQMWQEANDRAMHMKGATKPEDMKDNRKGKGAEDMMKAADDAAANPDTTVEKGMDDVSKAGRAGPTAKARPNDNMKGDKSIVNPVKKT